MRTSTTRDVKAWCDSTLKSDSQKMCIALISLHEYRPSFVTMMLRKHLYASVHLTRRGTLNWRYMTLEDKSATTGCSALYCKCCHAYDTLWHIDTCSRAVSLRNYSETEPPRVPPRSWHIYLHRFLQRILCLSRTSMYSVLLLQSALTMICCKPNWRSSE